MKQTNNAIKFLMAQYRAIFKNANIAMVAAIAAAALAAGQAQAAPDAATDLDNAKLTTALADAADGVEIVVDGVGKKDTSYKNFTISGAAAGAGTDLGNKAFTIKLTSGAHTIEGVATGGKLNAKSGSILLDGNDDVTELLITS